MSELRLNEASVLSWVLTFPLRGAWTAELTVDADEAPEGAVTLEIAQGDSTVELHGFAKRKGVFELKTRILVVGGAGGLSSPVESRYYTDTTARTVVEDLLRDAGEELDDSSSSDVLGTQLTVWTRRAGTAGSRLDALVRSLGAQWRVLQSGKVWVGTDEWAEVETEADLLREDKAAGTATVSAPSVPLEILPGSSFLERHVSAVTHEFGARNRTTVYFEDATPTDVSSQLRALIDQVTERLRWYSIFPARVSQQDNDGTLQVELDDATMPGLTRVPIRTFVPGASVKVAADARVHVLFEGGDPGKPVACLFDGDPSQLVELTITTADGATLKLAEGGNVEASPGDGSTVLLAGGGARVGRVGDSVRVTIPAGTFVTQVTGQAAGVLNPAPVDVDGEITEGAQGAES